MIERWMKKKHWKHKRQEANNTSLSFVIQVYVHHDTWAHQETEKGSGAKDFLLLRSILTCLRYFQKEWKRKKNIRNRSIDKRKKEWTLCLWRCWKTPNLGVVWRCTYTRGEYTTLPKEAEEGWDAGEKEESQNCLLLLFHSTSCERQSLALCLLKTSFSFCI